MRVITAAMTAQPCRLARCKEFFGHPVQPGGAPVLRVAPEVTVEIEGWMMEAGIMVDGRLRQVKDDLMRAASRGVWPDALPMKDAEREPCASCPWPRLSVSGHNCDDHAAWQGSPPKEISPGIAAMMRP